MSICLSIVNQKGGVAKTTSAINLTSYLAIRGKKTLLIDLDPQGNATSGLGIDKNNIEHSVYDVIINGININSCIISDVRTRLSLLPSNINLAGAEIELVSMKEREFNLKNELDKIKNNYDFILIDCPPSLGLLTLNALIASQAVIIPTQVEYYALEGLTQLISTLNIISAGKNENLKVFGVLLTMYDKRVNLAQDVASEVTKYFGDLVFDTVIPRNVRLSEAPSYGKTIEEYDRSSKGAEAYYNLANEVIKRAKKFK